VSGRRNCLPSRILVGGAGRSVAVVVVSVVVCGVSITLLYLAFDVFVHFAVYFDELDMSAL
jgi:hypothetical protein